MDYKKALDYIFSLPKLANKLGNDNLRLLLDNLGRPQKSLKFIHIVGTNGKGSAAAMLGTVLENAGYKTGLYTSPYILSFNERIRVGKDNISASDLAKYTEIVKKALEKLGLELSQFAFITAVAMVYYADIGCDAVVLEAGLGGRLDATNVIDESLLTIIMSISLDHTELLGDTVEEIAKEKCGVIKKGGRVVAYRNCENVNDVIKNCAENMGAGLYFADDSTATEKGAVIGGKEYTLSLSGEFQAKNAAVAVKAVEVLRKVGYDIKESVLEDGLKNAVHPCRFEKVRDNIIIDGAHNPDAVKALCRSLSGIEEEKTAVIAMMQDKDAESAVKELRDTFAKVIVTEIDMPRCMKKEKLYAICKEQGINAEMAESTDAAFEKAKRCKFAVIFGSIYLAGEAKRYFM